MRIIFLSEVATVIVDIVAWVCFHLSIGYLCSKIPIKYFNPQKSWYLTKKWEKGGEIYQKVFRVRQWKKIIPSGAAVYKDAYEIKHLNSFDLENVKLWLKESCRAEFCHWLMIFPGFFFFLWNSITGGWIMMIYAVLNNLVPIVMQRYNRPRVRKLIQFLETKNFQKGEMYAPFEQQKTFSATYQ